MSIRSCFFLLASLIKPIIAGNGVIKGSIKGISTSTTPQKLWLVFQALGDIAFSYPYSIILIEIQVITLLLTDRKKKEEKSPFKVNII